MALVALDVGIIGNEARAGEYLSGQFLCGVDPLRVSAGLTVTNIVYKNFDVAISRSGVVSADLPILRPFSVPISGVGAVTPAINVATMVALAAQIQGVAVVAPYTLGKSVDLAVSVNGVGVVTVSLARTFALAAQIQGQANVQAWVALKLALAILIAGQASLTSEKMKLTIVWLLPTDEEDLLLPPTVPKDWVLVPTTAGTGVLVATTEGTATLTPTDEEDWVLVPTTVRG